MISVTRTKRAFGFAAAAAVVFAWTAPALADDAAMAAMFGNTLVVKAPDGTESKVMYKDDMSYTTLGADGATAKGTWALADGKLCLTQVEPAPAAGTAPGCGPAPEVHAVGDTWQYTADDGQTYTLSLVAGQ